MAVMQTIAVDHQPICTDANKQTIYREPGTTERSSDGEEYGGALDQCEQEKSQTP